MADAGAEQLQPSHRHGPSRRAQLRAALLGFFVFFSVLGALPTFGTPSAERLERPFERAELRRWASLFGALGLEVTPERLAQLYLALTSSMAEARAIALAPIAGWMSLTHTSQRWALFATPDEYRSALRISVHAPGRDEVLYESGHPERRWNAELLGYRRIRAAYYPARSSVPHTYEGLGQRLSEQLFASQPGITLVRIVLERRRVAIPGASAEPGREERHVLEFARPSR